MKHLTPKFLIFSVLLLLAFMAIPSLLDSSLKKVQASAQDGSRSDVPPKTKNPKPRQVGGAAPANDNCASAINIAACPFTDTRNTSGATDEGSEPQSTCTLQGNSVWYTFTTGANLNTVNVTTCNSDFDTAIMVWQVPTATPCNFASFVAVACNDDFGGCGDGFQSSVGFTAQPNTTYKIQVGGFNGDTGNLQTNVTCQVLQCPPLVINGVLGTSSDYPGTQAHGNQVGRLNRNGVASSCAAPKSCQIFTATGDRAYDSYSIPNQSGADACVSINLSEPSNQTCNIQSNAYLNTYDPNSICTGYLGDPGLSTGSPPTSTNFSVIVPAGQTLIVVVHTTNPGESGCPYTLNIVGDLCAGFDYCIQQDSPRRFLQFSSTTGKYRYTDCSKNIIRNGTGSVSSYFCKTELSNGSGADSTASALVNPCTKKGDATIVLPMGTPPFVTTQTVKISDSDITNNICKCP